MPLSSDREAFGSTATTTGGLKVVVHFDYGGQKFPNKISIGIMSKFYKEVMSTLEKRIPGYKPHHLQFQCMDVWYDFTENTKFQDLCLEDEKPQLFVKAIPMPKESGNYKNS